MLTREPKGNPRHRGSIINIASLVSFQGGLNVPAYACAKGGVAQLTKSLSNQVSKFIGKRVLEPRGCLMLSHLDTETPFYTYRLAFEMPANPVANYL